MLLSKLFYVIPCDIHSGCLAAQELCSRCSHHCQESGMNSSS
jgi:hypothetical protein